MNTVTPQTTYLKDYRPPSHRVESLFLHFELEDHATIVTSHARYQSNSGTNSLKLSGCNLKLTAIALDGKPLSQDAYEIDQEALTLLNPPEEFELTLTTEIYPHLNKALNGLYQSGNIFCTQNEPEGFRNITYFLDRPDVLTIYTTKITANKKKYPNLLSNGNLSDSGDLPDGRHWVEWHDPFLKPSYLFALVAGDLGLIRDQFTTQSGKVVDLYLYCDKGNESKCLHAMESLKKSMRWDEERYGLEYDLDIYMIVAVDSFNMGAMENKGLNIFNTSCVLANSSTATDQNYARIETVVAHEYFHNWTGNRVTCRDWFQLTLKEGLTVYRDQEFSADMHSAPVKRIEDVQTLRNSQFPEDSGPTAHPIQPSSYIEINNFYTPTVYNKGAEIIRMIETLLGRQNFRKGMDLYFQRHDGNAVTTEDFVKAMEDASGQDLSQFRRWYQQAGTPVVKATITFYPDKRSAELQLSQTLKEGAEQTAPLLIPLKVGLIGKESGNELEFQLKGSDQFVKEVLIPLSQAKQEFEFLNLSEEPLFSLNRAFSAPIRLESSLSPADLALLMGRDSDPFTRWDAGQQLGLHTLLDMLLELSQGKSPSVNESFVKAFGEILKDQQSDPAWKALAMILPSETLLADVQAVIPFDANHFVRESLLSLLSKRFSPSFKTLYEKLISHESYQFTAKEAGRRSLRNLCLAYLSQIPTEEHVSLCYQQFQAADNMTDRFAALVLLVNIDHPYRQKALQAFYQEWKHDTLVMNKWLAAQASSKLPGTLEHVKQLVQSPVYDNKVPNLVRALLGSFVANLVHFHAGDGSGYAFITEQVLQIDPFNPQAAASLCQGFRRYPKLDPQRKELMQPYLKKILAKEGLSKNVYEIVSKSLNA